MQMQQAQQMQQLMNTQANAFTVAPYANSLMDHYGFVLGNLGMNPFKP